jgi:hypothetical protein
MKTKLLALALLAGGSMFAQSRFSVGVNVGGIGGYYTQAPPQYAAEIPPCPGPDYIWTDGYWADNGWINGFWARRPYATGYVIAPRYNYYARGYENRGFARRGYYENRGREDRGYEQNRGRGNGESYRGRGNGYGNGFRGR